MGTRSHFPEDGPLGRDPREKRPPRAGDRRGAHETSRVGAGQAGDRWWKQEEGVKQVMAACIRVVPTGWTEWTQWKVGREWGAGAELGSVDVRRE